MASVVINTRFNNRKAEADLKELQAKAKETAREINAVEKGLGSATTKRNKLRDDLEAARQKAAETAAALDEVNARLDAGRKSKFGVTSKGDETLSDKLAAKLQQQDTAVQAAADAYHAQDAAVQALQQRHAELTAQLAQEKDETTRQAEAVANAAQAAQAAQVDVSNVQRAANAMDAFVSKLFNAASVSKILKRSLSAIPNTLRALQELVGGDIECCRPWRDSVCVICNDSGKIDGLPPNRLYGHTDFLAGSFVVCGNGGEDFISLTDRQVFLYERLYHNPVVFLPTPHGLLPMKCTPEQYEQFQRDGNKLKIKPIDHGDR